MIDFTSKSLPPTKHSKRCSFFKYLTQLAATEKHNKIEDKVAEFGYGRKRENNSSNIPGENPKLLNAY